MFEHDPPHATDTAGGGAAGVGLGLAGFAGYRAVRANVSARQAELAIGRSQKVNRKSAERHAQSLANEMTLQLGRSRFFTRFSCR